MRVRSWTRLLLACLALSCANSAGEAEPECEAQRGEALFAQCAMCHEIAPSLGHGAGPNLFGVIGRPVGKVEGFKFSPALRRAEGLWTEERLGEFLGDPFTTFPGVRMAFAGIPNPADREALICFLTASDGSH